MSGRTPLFRSLAKATLRHEAAARPGVGSPSRRDVLARAIASAAMVGPVGRLGPAADAPSAPRVAIIGAGLAGLSCADRLQSKGVIARIYEGNTRIGGRCSSLRNLFPGQVAEYGGELIDTPHKTMLGYVNRFNLPLEDLSKLPGEVAYRVDGANVPESAVVAEYRVLESRMRADMKTLSGGPTFFSHTSADVALDQTSLADYLHTRAADLPIIRAVLRVAYEIEYGLDASEQSCLNLLLFIHADRRSKFTPFGVFSDERYHIVSGNDGVVHGLASDFQGTIETGAVLTKLAKNGSGQVLMYFNGSSVPEVADAAIVTLPFTVLRSITLDPSLGLSSDKRRAIDELGYGTNSKTMIGFNGAPWLTQYGSNGAAYSDLPNMQTCWETNPTLRSATSVLTDYSAGPRGAGLTSANLQSQVAAFLGDLEPIWPGIESAARKNGASYVARLANWTTYPWARGSYTCYRPGQFTSIAGLEGLRAGHLHFAGEHTDSFYSWQGYMEGACLSGIAAANEVLDDIKKKRL